METINSDTGLKVAILQLEIKQEQEGIMLREQFHLACETIKPANLVKNTLKAITESRDIKDTIISTSVGLAAGYLSKKLFVNVSHNPLKKLLGAALMFGITNVVAKNPGVVKSLGRGIFKIIRNKLAGRIGEPANRQPMMNRVIDLK